MTGEQLDCCGDEGCCLCQPFNPDDVLEQEDTVFFSDYAEMEEKVAAAQRAGIDKDTDCFTFMEMNGRNVFVTEV